MNSLSFKVFFMLIFLLCYNYAEKAITINIIPGTEECFFETLKNGQVFDIDYQVLNVIKLLSAKNSKGFFFL